MRKKLLKTLACLAVAGTVIVGSFGVSACSVTTKAYYGEYSYPNAWNPSQSYGIKVKVEVQSDDKGDRIKSVEMIDSTYVECTDSWADKDYWYSGIDELLRKYRGQYLADVLSESVKLEATGQPSDGQSLGGFLITGSTQGSGRLLLAVQNALADAAEELGYSVGEGEYSYPNAWAPDAPYYGIRVKAVVKGDVIQAVGVVPSGYVEVSDSWENKNLWIEGVEGLLSKYKGKKVKDVLMQTVKVNSTSVPGQPETVTDSGLVITGATQGSGRLLLAVQNALEKLFGYEKYVGEYEYESGAESYKLNVSCLLKGDVIVSADTVEIEDESNVPQTEEQAWAAGKASLLSKYAGKSIGEILTLGEGYTVSGAPDTSAALFNGIKAIFDKAGYKLKTGEYHYPNAWSPTAPEYGVNVAVVVKDDKLVSVDIVDGDYVSVTESWPEKHYWLDQLDGLLAKYRGKSVNEILAIEVQTNANGQPSDGQSLGGFVSTGATQGSGRLLKAVQNALSKQDDGSFVTIGEYHYPNAWSPTAPEYGVRVKTTVKDGAITAVEILDSNYTVVSDGWADKHYWDDEVDNLLAKYAGKTVDEVLALNVNVISTGQPSDGQEFGGLVSTGATQGSGRLLLAVQNSLCKLDGYKALTGEYHYPNAWSPESPEYGIKVRVILGGDEILCVQIVNSGYVEVSDGWGDKNLWIEGVEELLSKYKGKTVEEILAVEVGTNANGQPETVSDSGLVITGATQGSGRLLKAVQNALR